MTPRNLEKAKTRDFVLKRSPTFSNDSYALLHFLHVSVAQMHYFSLLLGLACMFGAVEPRNVPLINVYLMGKGINIFESASTLAYVSDVIELTGGTCIRSYNGAQYIVPDELCSSFTGAGDSAVHFGYFHGRTMDDMSVCYRQDIEFDLGISLIGGASCDLLDAGALTASSESQFSYAHFESKDANAFIGTAKTSCYNVRFSDQLPMKPAAEFKKRIQSAPLKYDRSYYISAIKNGTGSHTFLGADFGGKFNEIGFAGATTMASSFATDQELSVSCEANMWYTSCSYTNEAQLNADAQKYLHIVGANYNNHFVGPAPHLTDEKQYNADVCSNPQPTKVQLYPLPYYLTRNETSVLLEMSTDDLFTIAQNYIQAMNEYCTYETCYRTPKPLDPVWKDEVTVSNGQTKQLMKANEGYCLLTQVKSISFEHCGIYKNNETVGDAAFYWYVKSGSDPNTVCSARCSSKVNWAGNLVAQTNEEILASFRAYRIDKPQGTKGTTTLTLSTEGAETSFCTVKTVQNEVGCFDYCRVSISGTSWVLTQYTDNPWDTKHQDLNSAHRVCEAMCIDVIATPKLVYSATVDSTQGLKPLTLANETICVCEQIQGVCSTGEKGKGGSVHLKIQKIKGAVDDYWTVEGTTATGTDKCRGTCFAKCYSLA